MHFMRKKQIITHFYYVFLKCLLYLNMPNWATEHYHHWKCFRYEINYKMLPISISLYFILLKQPGQKSNLQWWVYNSLGTVSFSVNLMNSTVLWLSSCYCLLLAWNSCLRSESQLWLSPCSELRYSSVAAGACAAGFVRSMHCQMCRWFGEVWVKGNESLIGLENIGLFRDLKC